LLAENVSGKKLALILSGMMDVQHLQDRSKNDDEAGAKVSIRITITVGALQVSTNDWHNKRHTSGVSSELIFSNYRSATILVAYNT